MNAKANLNSTEHKKGHNSSLWPFLLYKLFNYSATAASAATTGACASTTSFTTAAGNIDT